MLPKNRWMAESRASVARLIALMKVTSPYQASLEEVKSPEGPIAGRPVLTFAPKDFISLRRSQQRPTGEMVRFVDVTNELGLTAAAAGNGEDQAQGFEGALLAAAGVMRQVLRCPPGRLR